MVMGIGFELLELVGVLLADGGKVLELLAGLTSYVENAQEAED